MGQDDPPDNPDRTIIGGADAAANNTGATTDHGRADATQIAQGGERTQIALPEHPPERIGEAKLVEPGTLINNNYRILELISAGGMGEVYRAENVFTGDPVAIKVILPGLARDASVLALFRSEARILVQLRDDAIVRYHNFVLDPDLDRYCLIMEFVQGRHLGTRVGEDGALSVADVMALWRRIGAGLARAHASGVTHRDLSPDNVILRDDRIDEAVLIDFGIARSTEMSDGLEGRFAGKFKYIAPEQLGHFEGRIGAWTDIYGLALLIAAVARGKPLDMGDSVVAASAARQDIPDLSGVSHHLFPLLQIMLEPDPENRPADMGMVLRMLDDPTLIASHYRLPLWRSAEREVTGISAMRDGSLPGADLGDSPFAAPPQPMPDAGDVARPAKPGRAMWMGAAAALLALSAVAGAVMWPRAQAAPDAPPADAPPAAATLPPRDTSTRDGFLASQPLPPCSYVARITDGPDAGMIAMLSAAQIDASALITSYGARFGAATAARQTRIAQPQCPALDFAHALSGRSATALNLQASAAMAAQGLEIRGAVSTDEEDGLWLFLVAPTGAIYDVTGQLNDAAHGARSFGFVLAQDGPSAPDAPYLLVALGTRDALASVAAAPAGVSGATLLPGVLDEIRDAGDAPAVAVVALGP